MPGPKCCLLNSIHVMAPLSQQINKRAVETYCQDGASRYRETAKKENYNLIRGSRCSLIFKAYYKNNSTNFADLKGCCNRYQSVYLVVNGHPSVRKHLTLQLSLILQIAFYCLRCYRRPTVKWQICWQMDSSRSSNRQLWDS